MRLSAIDATSLLQRRSKATAQADPPQAGPADAAATGRTAPRPTPDAVGATARHCGDRPADSRLGDLVARIGSDIDRLGALTAPPPSPVGESTVDVRV